jgi:hypothetical protein
MLVDPGNSTLSCESHCFMFVDKRQVEFHLMHVFRGKAIPLLPVNAGVADDVSIDQASRYMDCVSAILTLHDAHSGK